MRRSLLAAVSLLSATGACTSLLGDFTLRDAGSADGGQPGTEGGPTTLSVTAVAVAANVYLGATTILDGTQSTATEGGLNYSWTLSPPNGSILGTGSIGGANQPTATLKPDVVGEYVLKLVVTSTMTSSVQSTATVTVYCGLPQAFYAQGTGTQVNASYNVAALDGGGAHSVTCLDTAPTDPVNSGADIPAFASYAGRAYDFWEAPPLDPMVEDGGPGSHLAAFMVDYVAGSGYATHLYGASSVSTCDAGVTDYGATGFGYGKPYGSEPRFRPDGQRFAVFDANWNILTYAWGSTTAPNSVASYPIQYPQASSLDPSVALGADGGILQSYFQEPPHIEWMGTSVDGGPTTWQVAWAAPAGGTGWALVTAPDQSHAQPTTYMTCPGLVPRQFAILSDGSVIASYRQTATGAEDLVHLKPPMNGSCNAITNYTNLSPQVASTATDFAISPDGQTIAFLRFDPQNDSSSNPWALNGAQLPGGYLYTVPVGGGASDLTKLTPPEPAIYGPRWIGGGTQLLFTRLDGVSAAGNLKTSVVTVLPGGGTPAVVVQGDGVKTFVSTNGNAACGIGPTHPAGGAAGLIGLVGLAGIARRRRRG